MKKSNMKKIIVKYAVYMATALPLVGVGGGFFSSCSDQLELKPQGEFTADQLTDESIEGLMSSEQRCLCRPHHQLGL